MPKIKILVATPYFPYPLNSGGNQAQFHFIDRIRSEYEIHILFPIVENARQCALASMWPEVVFHPYKRTILERCKDYILRKSPFCKSGISRPNYERTIKPSLVKLVSKIVKENSIDIFQFEFTKFLGLAFLTLKTAKKVFVHHEIGFVRQARENEAQNQVLSSEILLVNEMKKNREILALNCCDAVITLTTVDKDILYAAGVKSSIYSSPAMIPKKKLSLAPFQFNGQLVFVGGSAHYPNSNGMRWFLNEIWPRVSIELPHLKLNILGRWPEDYINGVMLKHKNVAFLGFVDDLDLAVSGSIMIVPILIGSGMRMKIIDAVNSGCPILTTTTGVEGIDLRNNIDCLIADTIDEWVECITNLVNSNSTCDHFVHSAWKRFSELYGDSILLNKRVAVYKDLIREDH